MITTVIVTVWTAISVIGIGVSTWALVDCFLDGRAQRLSGANGMQRVIVRLNLRSAQASLLLHSFFLLLGIRAYIVAPATTGGFLFVASGYILVAATNVRAVGLNQFDRWWLRKGRLPT
jgi:hypothetical protein